MFYLSKHLPFLYLVILKPRCNNLNSTLIMILYACVLCLLHSRFVENHSVDLEVTNLSFLRWFCHKAVDFKTIGVYGNHKVSIFW
jgi:hypothetical protein